MPQAGEHAVPLAVNVQVTPVLGGSFCTVALNWAEKYFPVPAASPVTLFLMVTTLAGTMMATEANFEGFVTEVAVTVTVRSAGMEVGAL